MAPATYQITHRCGCTTEQLANPGAVESIREVANRFPCTDCRATANPFAPQRRMGRGRGSSR